MPRAKVSSVKAGCFFDTRGDYMSLEVTIHDNEKLIDKLFEDDSVFSKQELTPSDVAIISLYYSALSNAKAIKILVNNKLTNVTVKGGSKM